MLVPVSGLVHDSRVEDCDLILSEVICDDDSLSDFEVIAMNDVDLRASLRDSVTDFGLACQTPLNSVVDVEQARDSLDFAVYDMGCHMAFDDLACESHVACLFAAIVGVSGPLHIVFRYGVESPCEHCFVRDFFPYFS